MSEQRQFRAIKGTRDILPPESTLWNTFEATARVVMESYGFREIRLPIFEETELFARSVGADTDIVSKEMYTFSEQSRSGEPNSASENLATISLRPEATASVCRAYIEHGMHTLPGNVKLYYIGPMFRRERPQKGRYRQFYQIGAEVLSKPGGAETEATDLARIDAEVIEMLMVFFERIGFGGKGAEGQSGKESQNSAREFTPTTSGPLRHSATGLTLHLNSIGCRECRPKYVAELKKALEGVRDKLGPDSQRRIETNPLRVLDSKLPEEQPVIEKLPRISDYLCDACRAHFAALKDDLQNVRGIAFQENWRLVRGLDYYTRTTFEITAGGLGAQDAVCGGGRYDGLVELLGGPATRGIGFAIGTDRTILSLLETGKGKATAGLDVYLAWLGATSYPAAARLARRLRAEGFSVELPAEEMKLKKSLGLADKLGARFALILGENEVAAGRYTLKRLADAHQVSLAVEELVAHLKKVAE
jgi:histidyl-tRNA synthetase